MVPMHAESTEDVIRALRFALPEAALYQVMYIATDAPSASLWKGLKELFPNLLALSLDTTHLPMVCEYASGRKKTEATAFLRRIMVKLNRRDDNERLPPNSQ